MSRLIEKRCRGCGNAFTQPSMQALRPVEYCSERCRVEARRRRNAAGMRAAYSRRKALGYAPEERIEELGFGA